MNLIRKILDMGWLPETSFIAVKIIVDETAEYIIINGNHRLYV